MTQKISFDLPNWVIQFIEEEAQRRGVTQEILIKMWLIDRIDKISQNKSGLVR